MKRNVDLTQNRLFSQADEISTIISSYLIKALRGQFPWSVDERAKSSIDSDWSLRGYGENELIFVGNVTERRQKNLSFKMDKGLFCDCCGIELTKKPWARHYCLCLKCAVDNGKSYRIWSEIDIRASSDRVIIEMNKNNNI